MTASDTVPVRLDAFMNATDVIALVRQAMGEDMGPQHKDVTSELLVPSDVTARAVVQARQPGHVCGVPMMPVICQVYDAANLAVEVFVTDGQTLEAGTEVCAFRGPLRSILALERVALNFLSHLSGIATLTARYVQAVTGTRAAICATRKTIPGLRGLGKYAVVCGGGQSHRMGLHDAVLVKDNHIARIPLDDLATVLEEARRAASSYPQAIRFFEVEVDTCEQLERVLHVGPDLVLLDNMTIDQLSHAVAMRDRLQPTVLLEASGRVSLETVAAIARTDVDWISVGAMTHSAPALDLGLDLA